MSFGCAAIDGDALPLEFSAARAAQEASRTTSSGQPMRTLGLVMTDHPNAEFELGHDSKAVFSEAQGRKSRLREGRSAGSNNREVKSRASARSCRRPPAPHWRLARLPRRRAPRF